MGELLKVYEKTRSACGGVALAEVHEGACSCRNTFDSSRMRQNPLPGSLGNVCPVCRRLLIVEGNSHELVSREEQADQEHVRFSSDAAFSDETEGKGAFV